MIVIDEDCLDRFRSASPCEWCKKPQNRREPHHAIAARGMGGGGRIDVPENLIGLCIECHAKVHAGRIIKADLVAVIAARMGKLQDDVIAVVREIWRRENPKKRRRK